mmetsp:Transcript_9150/g.27488  ORF Transcript_9150/g.27488 Transcript_9150/m.27488 type:complete len:214 (-) Transcript_9150:299-940(-)
MSENGASPPSPEPQLSPYNNRQNHGGGRQTISIFGGYPDDSIEHPTVRKSPFKGVDNATLPAAGISPKIEDGSFNVAQRPGLETKLKHCLIGSDIFADQTPGIDARQQFSASPNGKIREVSEAKKKALQGNDIFAEKVEEEGPSRNLAFSEAKLQELSGSDIFGAAQQDAHRSSLKVRKPPGGGSSIVFGDPAEHISLQYRNPEEEPIKIIGN